MTQNVNIAVKTESGQVKKISHGVIFQPETQFKGGSVKWFDDSKRYGKCLIMQWHSTRELVQSTISGI